MNEMFLYFRRHPWQRLTLTLSFTAMLAAGLAVVLNPLIGDLILLHRLSSSNIEVRHKSADALAVRALSSPRTLARLERRLTSDDDAKFLAAARVLNMIGQFSIPSRDTETIDRWWAIQMAHTADANVRRTIIWEACILDRDDRFLRRLLATAAGDGEEEIRALSAILAAKLADDATLERLLADESAEVRAIAAIDAGIAGRKELLERAYAGRAEPDSYAADCMLYALALVGSDLAAPAVCENLARLTSAGEDDQARPSLDRNLLIAGMLLDSSVTDAVMDLFEAYADSGRHVPPIAMVVAARRGMTDTAPHVRNVLRAAMSSDRRAPVTGGQLWAALEAAEALNMPVRQEVYEIVKWLWGSQLEDVMVTAARVLGRQADLPQDVPDEPVPSTVEGPTREGCITLLRGKATWLLREQIPGQPDELHRTPLASASAALALWRLRTPLAEDYIRHTAWSRFTLPGDYVAWHIAMEGPAAGMELGMNMLPALEAPHELRVYNNNERAAGAMLLALSARTDQQRADAARRISSRLIGGQFGGEDDRHVRWAFMCALTITGDRTYLGHLSALLSVTEFPRHRLLTALLVAGDSRGMDWLLWNAQLSDASVISLLIDRRIDEVLWAVAPELPRIERAASQDIRIWQARILRDTYAIRHADILSPEPP